jgi:benzoylformate decarboxylase
MRRAIKIATTPPMGPVFLALPMDVLDAPNCEPVVPTARLVTRVIPEREQVSAAADMLVGARRPVLLLGDGIAASGAQAEAAHVAELLGAEIWGADSSEVNVPADHPLFRGQLGHMFGTDSRRITSQADVVLVCGTYVLPEVFPSVEGVFAADARVIHIDLDAYEIAKNFPVDLGLVSDPKLTLAALALELETIMAVECRDAARTRAAQIAGLNAQVHTAQRKRDMAVRDDVPMHASRFMEELGAALPRDAIVFDEALTCSPDLTRYVPPTTPGHYFQTHGGSLGTGIPGALGLKLAHPDKTVIGLTGDGGSMYTIQALWSAAHHRIGAKFVVCNNRSYQLLKLNIQQYWQTGGRTDGVFPSSFDLCDPDLRFDKLARSMGVPAVRVHLPNQIEPAIRRALAHDGPFLIDAVFTNALP